jgi:hydrogenase-4 component B
VIPILVAILALTAGAVLSIAFTSRPRVASWLGASSAIVSCGFGGFHAARALASGSTQSLAFEWSLPNASLALGLDPLSSFFLVPLFLLGGIAACYGRVYLIEHSPTRNQSVPWAAFNLMLAGMALVLVARHAVLFLFAWEAMSLAAFLLIGFDHHDAAVRRASFVYLIATHLGVTCLLAFFLLLGSYAHSFEFSTIAAAPALGKGVASLLFLLALIGFGAKAGMFPLHVWLPEAHAAAPSHVSALMSGILIKMGIYGILRTVLLLGGPRPFWGQLLMVLGLAGGLLGIGCALYQRDIKRLLAYSSVENVGLILLSLGTALWGMTSNRPLVALLALLGGLLHVWNHAVMKGLMFLGAGSVVHQCHAKDLEQLGGLYRRMPHTALVLLIGATAMAGLPPLNGFLSEWLMYSGLLRAVLSSEGGVVVAAMAAIAGASLIGAMAALCFCRLIGIALLGTPRSRKAETSQESSHWMVLPMMVLALINVALALSPVTFTTLFRPVVSQLMGHPLAISSSQLGLSEIGTVNRGLFVAIVVVGVIVLARTQNRVRVSETWGCGYPAPSGRIQYTGRAFSQLFTSNILPRSIGPRYTAQIPTNFFPTTSRVESESVDPVTRSVYEPFFESWANRFVRLRFMQQGILHVYVLYILVTLLFALTWSAIRTLGGFG